MANGDDGEAAAEGLQAQHAVLDEFGECSGVDKAETRVCVSLFTLSRSRCKVGCKSDGRVAPL